MAAHLDLIRLRRHTPPASSMVDFDGGADWTATRAAVPAAGPRSRLFASWHIGSDGRLACSWFAAPDDPA